MLSSKVSVIFPRLGERIALRRLEQSDLSAFQRYRSDQLLAQYQGWSTLSDSEAHAFVLEMQNAPLFRPGAWTQIAIASRITNELIGDIGLFLALDNSRAEIGFTLAREAQGTGLGTEAVREAIALVFAGTSVARIVAVTDARNTKSIQLLQRLGLTLTETNEATFKGELCCEHTFVVLRHDVN